MKNVSGMSHIKRYKILSKLGSGGMGQIYKAYDPELEREVAIKILHKQLLGDDLNNKRLVREARAAAKLIHPNVVTIYEIGEEECGRYIVMEYVEGTVLSDIIYEEEHFSPQRAINLSVQVLQALNEAHAANILHRDIKTENILVKKDDQVKVLDFGIAKFIGKDSLTVGKDIFGTLEYMSPEQMLGEDVDPRSDIYACGIVLYRMLTREFPFQGDTPVEILFKKLNEEPVPPSHYNPKVSAELDATVLRAINQASDDRWSTTEDFIDALESSVEESSEKEKRTKTKSIDFDLFSDDAVEDENQLRPVFIGRKAELSRLIKNYERAISEGGRSVIIRGEAGVGKSSLVNRFRSYVEHKNAWVLYGSCLYQEGMDAYLPYIEALRGFMSKSNTYLSKEHRENLKVILRQEIPALSNFTERFTTVVVPNVINQAAAKENLFESFQSLFSVLSKIQPVVIIIDDLQWADTSSLKLFFYLARRVSETSALLVGISRTDQYDLQEKGKPTAVIDMLARMRREGLYEEINIDRFSKPNSIQLTDKLLSDKTAFSEEFYDGVYEETKGNPFFIFETLKSLQNNGNIVSHEGVWSDLEVDFKIEVPNRVEDIFIRRLSEINDSEREILQVASVIGYKFDPGLIGEIIEQPKLKVLKILQRLEKDFALIQSTSRNCQFEHPMLADILYNEIPAILRKEYHCIVADLLVKIRGEELGAMVGDTAEHFRKGGEHQKALPLLITAGNRTFNLSAYREASIFFEHFLDSSAQTQFSPEDFNMIDLYFKLGICYEEMGRWDMSRSAYENLADISLKEDNFEKHVNAVMRIGRLYDKLGQWKKALEAYEKCLKLAEKYKIKNVRSRINNNIGIYYFHQGDFDSALEYFQQAIGSIDSDYGEYDKAHAYTNIGIIANILRGENNVALENFNKALDIYIKKGSTRNQARLYQNIGMFYSDRGNWEESIEAFEKCLQITNQTEEKQLRALTYLNLGKAYARQKVKLEAKSFCEKALRMFKRMNDILGIADVYHVFGMIYAHDGDLSKSERFLSESININREKDFKDGLAETYETYAQVMMEYENKEKARELYQEAKSIYKFMNIAAKVDEIEKIINIIDGNKVKEKKRKASQLEIKLLRKRYGKAVNHS